MTPASNSHLRAWSAIATLYQEVLRPVVARLEAETGLDAGAYSALAYLERAERSGRMPLAELQELLRVRYSQPGVSRLVQRMERDGFVTRQPDERDARAAIVVITRTGRACYRRAERVYQDALTDHFGGRIDASTAARIADLLDAPR